MKTIGLIILFGGVIIVGFFLLTFTTDFSIFATNKSNETPSYVNLEEYYNSIDYSCTNNADCVVKDVHNCCGYYPKCANRNALVDLDFVREGCEEENMGSVCGFPSITGCECEDSVCRST